jgi:methylated-DNA-[protein]-cysteine S-methyltransferase
MSTKRVVFGTMPSPIGPLTIACTDKGVCAIEFGKDEKAILTLQFWCRRWLHTDRVEQDQEALQEAIRQLNEYFDGHRTNFDLPLDLYGTPFQRMVWDQLLLIPYGETRSYKDIAFAIKSPKSVRAVGGANHHNPVPIIIPCHRVVGTNGALVGYGGGLSIKEALLDLERRNCQSNVQ